MGKVSDLKVYNDVELLAGWVLDISANFPKQYRYITERLVNTIFDCMDDITLANLREGTERAMFLDAFVVHFTSVKTILRVCTRKRILSVNNEALFFAVVRKYRQTDSRMETGNIEPKSLRRLWQCII